MPEDSPLPAAFYVIDLLHALPNVLTAGNASNTFGNLLTRHGALLEKPPVTMLAA